MSKQSNFGNSIAKDFVKKKCRVLMRFIDKFSGLEYGYIAPLKYRFEFHLDEMGRKALFSWERPEEMLCKHVQYILDNYEHMGNIDDAMMRTR